MTCPCHRCTMELVEREPWDSSSHQDGDGIVGMIDPRVCRMFVCQTCGNKRCPHAADHRLACSGSNAPGQKGSLYEDAPSPPRDTDRSGEADETPQAAQPKARAGAEGIAQPQVLPYKTIYRDVV